MRSNDGTRTGGEILIDQLAVQGVRHAFCVPGESYLAALDALHGSDIKLTVCRHESTAAMMAEKTGIPTPKMPAETIKLAMTVVVTGPIVLLYPFLQKYFIKGMNIGAVKG